MVVATPQQRHNESGQTVLLIPALFLCLFTASLLGLWFIVAVETKRHLKQTTGINSYSCTRVFYGSSEQKGDEHGEEINWNGSHCDDVMSLICSVSLTSCG